MCGLTLRLSPLLCRTRLGCELEASLRLCRVPPLSSPCAKLPMTRTPREPRGAVAGSSHHRRRTSAAPSKCPALPALLSLAGLGARSPSCRIGLTQARTPSQGAHCSFGFPQCGFLTPPRLLLLSPCRALPRHPTEKAGVPSHSTSPACSVLRSQALPALWCHLRTHPLSVCRQGISPWDRTAFGSIWTLEALRGAPRAPVSEGGGNTAGYLVTYRKGSLSHNQRANSMSK